MSSILWRRLDRVGMERAVLESAPDGFRLSGTVLLVESDGPIEVRYSVLTDTEGRTRTVGAHVQTPTGDRRLALKSDGAGTWSAGDDPVLELYGAVDVDLAWTPATNTLAIRRLNLEIGESAEASTVYIAFPAHEIERRNHRYERLAPLRYRYRSGDFETDLTVNEQGLVVAYPGRWTTEAES
jgi:hypothetical protein